MKRLALLSFSLCLTPLALAAPPAPDERTTGTAEQREAAAQDSATTIASITADRGIVTGPGDLPSSHRFPMPIATPPAWRLRGTQSFQPCWWG